MDKMQCNTCGYYECAETDPGGSYTIEHNWCNRPRKFWHTRDQEGNEETAFYNLDGLCPHHTARKKYTLEDVTKAHREAHKEFLTEKEQALNHDLHLALHQKRMEEELKKNKAIDKALLEAYELWKERAEKGEYDDRDCPLCSFADAHDLTCKVANCPLFEGLMYGCCKEYRDGSEDDWTPARIFAMANRLKIECEKRGLIKEDMESKRKKWAPYIPDDMRQCYFCGKPMFSMAGNPFGKRYDADGKAKRCWCCPECRADNRALLDSLTHWEENVELFEKEKPQNQHKWFNNHCQTTSCSACQRFRPATNWKDCGACPLSPACCNKVWDKAASASRANTLTVSHLAAVRDYIKQVCVDRGIYKDKSIAERICDQKEILIALGIEPNTIELGRKEKKELEERINFSLPGTPITNKTFYEGMKIKLVDAESFVKVYKDKPKCTKECGLGQSSYLHINNMETRRLCEGKTWVTDGKDCIRPEGPKLKETAFDVNFYKVNQEVEKGVCLPMCEHAVKQIARTILCNHHANPESYQSAINEFGTCPHGKGFILKEVE